MSLPGPVPGSYGSGGAAFFVSWLTRYPNLGPFNREVLLGFGAVVACAALPFGAAVHALLARSLRARKAQLLWAIALLPPFTAVFVRLDLATWLTAVRETRTALDAAALAGGAAIRAATFLALWVTTLGSGRDREA